MSNSKQAITDAVRAAGGIVHSDGNIFFTRAEQFLAAASALQQQDADALSDERIMELAKAYTWFNGSHAMTDYVKFARAAIDAAMKAGEARDADSNGGTKR